MSAKSPLHSYRWYFEKGYDTLAISVMCRVSEAEVYNGLYHQSEQNRKDESRRAYGREYMRRQRLMDRREKMR